MRYLVRVLLTCLVVSLISASIEAQATEVKARKKWALLVFLNGFNNLDSFGSKDLNEMEMVGSTKDIHVVVQWASLQSRQVNRVYVQKDTDPRRVTSPVVQPLGQIDMGDYRNLVEFVRWASEKYPADHYFVDVWNHGSGWHKSGQSLGVRDISSDDLSGNVITTEQLGRAMNEISSHLGKKVSIYGSDACLMGMIEVAGEMKNAVNVYIGSQHLEPGDGWAYDRFLSAWSTESQPTPEKVAQLLTQTYSESYPGSYEITLSAYRMSAYDALVASLRELSMSLRSLSSSQIQQVRSVAQATTDFFFADYRDLGEFLTRLKSTSIRPDIEILASQARSRLDAFVISNRSSADLPNATGVSIWMPGSRFTFDNFSSRYGSLGFNSDSDWLTVADLLVD